MEKNFFLQKFFHILLELILMDHNNKYYKFVIFCNSCAIKPNPHPQSNKVIFFFKNLFTNIFNLLAYKYANLTWE